MGGAYPVQPWKAGAQTTVVDKGSGGDFAATMGGGLAYNYTDRSLQFNGSGYAAAGGFSGASLVGPFTILTAVRPTTTGAQSTVWEFGSGSERLSLQVDGMRFVLRFGAAAAARYLAPSPWLATHQVAVRCSSGRLLCTIT